jgi:hypothetical protein
MTPNLTRGRARWAAWIFSLAVIAGAAPAAPSYDGITRAIASVRALWTKPGTAEPPTAPGWYSFFDSLASELAAYTAATTDDARGQSLAKLDGMVAALRTVPGTDVDPVRAQLESWLKPRQALHAARTAMASALAGFPPAKDDADTANRKKWQTFLDEKLAVAIKEYETSRTVAARHEAHQKLIKALADLRERNGQYQWAPALSLASAVEDLVDRPNLDVQISDSILADLIARRGGIVASERIYFREQWSTVTPGAMQGVGFIPNGNGISLRVSQAMKSVTPIQGFHERLAADARGQRAAKLYTFAAQTQNNGVATMQANISLPYGVQLQPIQLVNLSAYISSVPTPGGGMGRLFASLLGQSQRAITQKVYDGAIGRMQSESASGTAELASRRAWDGNLTLNNQVRPYILDGQTVGYGDFRLSRVHMQSFPAVASISGMIGHQAGAAALTGAPPQPPELGNYLQGVTVDLHLASVLSNLVRGYYETADVRDVQSLLIETGLGTADQPVEERIRVTQNADVEAFLKANDEAKASNNPNRKAIRIKKVAKPPVFGVDSRGRLIVLLEDVEIDVPAPANLPGARAYQIISPRVEVVAEVQVIPAQAGENYPRVKGRFVEFDPGREFKAFELGKGEPKPVNPIQSRLLVAGLSAGMEQQTIDFPITKAPIPGVALSYATPLDASGWMRLLLVPVR